MTKTSYLFLALYVGSVVLVNILFSYVPMIEVPAIGLLSPVAILVGFTFILRDYAQRTAGHFVLVAMALGTLISFLMADPFVATASAIAFASSEIADYLVYTATKRPFRERVALSSLISAPIDTVVFLYLIGAFTWGTVALMILAKLVAVLIIWNTHKEAESISNPYYRA